MIATWYPLSHGTFLKFAAAYALSVTAFSCASSPIGGAKGRALPAQRPEIFAQLIRRHHPYARKNFEPAFLRLPNCEVLSFKLLFIPN